MCGFADQRDPPRREFLAVSISSGNSAAPGLDRDLAEQRMRAPFDLRREASASSARAGRPRRLDHADEARRRPGRGTRVNGPVSVWNSVEIPLCGRRVAEVEGKRHLRIAAARSRCRLRRGRAIASIGPDRKPRLRPCAAIEPERHAGLARLDRRGGGRDAQEGVARRAPRGRRAGAGSRCCSRTPQGRFPRPQTEPPGRGSAVACRRSGGSRRAARPRRGPAARPPAPPTRRPSPTAGPWCGYRAARPSRSARYPRPLPRARWPP